MTSSSEAPTFAPSEFSTYRVEVTKTQWMDTALIIGLIVFSTLSVLAYSGTFTAIGTTYATYLSYALYLSTALFFVAGIVKLAVNCAKKTRGTDSTRSLSGDDTSSKKTQRACSVQTTSDKALIDQITQIKIDELCRQGNPSVHKCTITLNDNRSKWGFFCHEYINAFMTKIPNEKFVLSSNQFVISNHFRAENPRNISPEQIIQEFFGI